MFQQLLSKLARPSSFLKRGGETRETRPAEYIPLDPVEHLQRNGTTLPVMIEFTRLGW